MTTTTTQEFTIGTEDRIWTDGSQWWYQIRGCSTYFGPFDSRDDAEADYNE